MSCAADGHVIAWLLADLERNDCSQMQAIRPWDALADTVLSLTLEGENQQFFIYSTPYNLESFFFQSLIDAFLACQ